MRNAGVAQLVERQLPKLNVASSNLVARSGQNGRSSEEEERFLCFLVEAEMIRYRQPLLMALLVLVCWPLGYTPSMADQNGADATVIRLDEAMFRNVADLGPYLEYTTQDLQWDSTGADGPIHWTPLREHLCRMSREILVQVPDWDGHGWFRCRFSAGRTAEELSISILTYGGYRLYLDGTEIAVVGSMEPGSGIVTRKRIIPLHPYLAGSDSESEHTLLIEANTQTYRYLMNDGKALAFSCYVGPAGELYGYRLALAERWAWAMTLPLGTILTLAVLHALLFLFDRRSADNLLYSVFALTLAGILLSMQMPMSTTSIAAVSIWNQLNVVLFVGIIGLALLLISQLLYGTISRTRYLAAAAGVAAVLLAPFLIEDAGTPAWGVFVLMASIDVGRLTVRAIRRRVEGAWLIGIGLLLFSIYLMSWFAAFYLQVIPLSETVWRVIFVSGVLGMPASMSIFLAVRISGINRRLREQLTRVEELTEEKVMQERRAAEEELRHQQLEADHQRKTLELEEARKLQFSMLPTSMPSTQHLQTSIAMNTATEVGGDYVDYYIHGPEQITFAIGDATGHGMKAGVMVATAKSHFQTHAISQRHDEILTLTSDGIRRLNLRGLYMCMALLTIDGSRCSWTSAGIPPLLQYRASDGAVVHHLVKGLPLGAPRVSEARTLEFDAAPGDVLLLFTDGLPELFDTALRSLGIAPIEDTLRTAAGGTTTEIIDALVELAEQWKGDGVYNDDVTLLAVKFR